MSPDQTCHSFEEVKRVLAEIFEVKDMSALNLFRQIKILNHLIRLLLGEYSNDDNDKLSHARMRLLIRLEADARLGRDEGVLPSELSRWLGVSRNTVSALLNGLEEQNLIARHLHPTDRRQIQIRITEAGHELVQERAPQDGAFITNLFTALSPEEQAILADLLQKLLKGMVQQATRMNIEIPNSVSLSEQSNL